MAERTPFAGLLRIPPGEPLSVEGFEFQFTDPLIIDQFLKIGAVTHKHDGKAALANPIAAPTLATGAAGGSIPAATTIKVGYTWIDPDGGETAAGPTANITTGATFPEPHDVPTAVVSNAAGALLAANYIYGVTVTDGEGGESGLSPLVEAVVEPGFAKAEVTVSKLKAILTEVAGATVGAEWRLWRRQNGGEWNLIDMGTGETIVDDGTLVPDCTVQPPTISTMHATNKLTVEVPKPVGDAEFFRLYLTTEGTFSPVSYVAEYPIAECEKAIELLTLAVLPGSPPAVSHAIPHANKIDPDTDLIEWHWKRPVTKFSELPTEGNEEGDTRMVVETRRIYFWDATADDWEPLVATMWIPATWSIADAVTVGTLPGPFTRLAPNEEQKLVYAECTLAEGEVKLTLKHNGVAVVWLKEMVLKEGETLALTGAELALGNKDTLTLDIEEASGTAKGFALTAFIEHIA
jgi:hypothetical protein